MTDTTAPAEPQPRPFDPALPGRIARFLEAGSGGETVAIRGTRVLRRSDLAELLERDRYAEKTRLQLAEACARLRQERDESEAKSQRDSDELRDKRTDLLEIRGILSPNGHAPKVPAETLEDTAAAVQWLVDRVAQLEGQLGDDTQWGIRVYVAPEHGEHGSYVLTGYTEAVARHHATEFTHRAEPVFRCLGAWVTADAIPAGGAA